MSAQPHVPWSDEERQQLRQLWENGLGRVRIARLMGRSTKSVSRQMQTLHLHRPFQAPQPAPQPIKRASPLKPGATTLPPLASLRGVPWDDVTR